MKNIDLLNNFSESDSLPRFLMCIDENDTEYVLNLSSLPCIIKINGIMDSDEDDDEDDEDGGLMLLDEEDGDIKNFTFDIEIFRISETGIKPLGRERSLQSVQKIIKDAIDYYIEQNKE